MGPILVESNNRNLWYFLEISLYNNALFRLVLSWPVVPRFTTSSIGYGTDGLLFVSAISFVLGSIGAFGWGWGFSGWKSCQLIWIFRRNPKISDLCFVWKFRPGFEGVDLQQIEVIRALAIYLFRYICIYTRENFHMAGKGKSPICLNRRYIDSNDSNGCFSSLSCELSFSSRCHQILKDAPQVRWNAPNKSPLLSLLQTKCRKKSCVAQ